MFLKTLVSIVIFTTSTMAAGHYTNCEFRTPQYHDVCEDARAKGVSIQYINEFLVSEKAKTRDLKSFALFHPKQIKMHHRQERHANNALVAYVPTIVAHLKAHEKTYDYAEQKYQVDRELIASILMKETRLGKIRPRHDAFVVFNTLLLKSTPTSSRDKWLIKMARANMVHIIKHCHDDEIAPDACDLDSSYAGAVGIPQFMPMNFHHIEGYQRDKGDLWDMDDAIVSTSRFLHHNAALKRLIDWSKLPDMDQIESDWYDFDFQHANASFGHCCNRKGDVRYDCFACDKPELAYLVEYMKKVMRYNNSSNYAIGVLRLAYDAHRLLKADHKP